MFSGRESPGVPAAEPPTEDADIARIVTRFSSEYVLRALQLLIEQHGDIRTGLVAQAIDTANTAHLDVRTPEGRRAAGPNGVIPDEMRRPIELASLAGSTGLPIENTCEIVQRLIDQRACVHVEGGVMMPSAAVESPKTSAAVLANLGYARRLARDLESVGLTTPPAKDHGAVEDLVVARLVARRCGAYLVRSIALLAKTYGDFRTGILVQTIIVANTAYLDVRSGEGRRYAGLRQNLPDKLRRPISVAHLAEALGSPLETKRRHVQGLIDAGLCVRVRGGLIVPGAVLETPAAVCAMLTNVGYARRFVHDLRLIGA